MHQCSAIQNGIRSYQRSYWTRESVVYSASVIWGIRLNTALVPPFVAGRSFLFLSLHFGIICHFCC